MIAKDCDMTKEAFRVLTYFYSKLDFDNFIYMKHRSVSVALNIKESNLSKAIKLLLRKKIVLQEKTGARKSYKLNGNYGLEVSASSLEYDHRDQFVFTDGGKCVEWTG